MVPWSALGYDSVMYLPWAVLDLSLFSIPVLIGWYIVWRVLK